MYMIIFVFSFKKAKEFLECHPCSQNCRSQVPIEINYKLNILKFSSIKVTNIKYYTYSYTFPLNVAQSGLQIHLDQNYFLFGLAVRVGLLIMNAWAFSFSCRGHSIVWQFSV